MWSRLIAVLCCVGLSAWSLWPALQDPHGVLIGGWAHPDCLSNHWLLAWVAERLLQGASILHNPDYYWPVGDAPVLAGNGAEGFAYLPFHLLLGWPAGSVAYVSAVLVLNGLAGYGLGRAAGGGPWASLAAAGLSAAFPYPLQELSAGRFTQAAICWPTAAIAAWLWLLQRPSRRAAVGCGLLTAAAGFFYWYHGLFVCLADSLLLAAFLAHRRPPPWRSMLLAAGIALAAILPWAVVFFSAWSQIPGTAEDFPSVHAAMRSAPLLPRALIGDGPDSALAASLPLWLLGLAGLWAGRRSWVAQGLALCALVFGWLSLGPTVSASLYVALYGLAAPLRRFWWPMRHVVVVNAAWAGLAAIGLGALTRRAGRWAPLVGLLAVAAGPLGLWARGIPTQPQFSALTLPPRLYPDLAALPDGVLIEPPLWPGAASAQQHLIYQRTHRKPLLTGHALWVDRLRPDAWDAFVAGNSFLSALQRLEAGQLGDTFSFEAADLAALQADGVRWMSVNRELFPLRLQPLLERYRTINDALFGDAVLTSSAGARVWDLQAWSGQTTVPIEPWAWPEGVTPGGPDISISGRRPASMSFSELAPPSPPPPPPPRR